MKKFVETDRLILRSWCAADLEAFAEINACVDVCRFLPKTLSRDESDQLAKKIITHFDKYGFGLFAVELKNSGQFIGFTGLQNVGLTAHFTPACEIGWRISFKHWNKGYATEAAAAVRNYAFKNIKLGEIVSFTAEQNLASRRVMEKIGMTHNKGDDFNHPNLPEDSPLSMHVLYRLGNHLTH